MATLLAWRHTAFLRPWRTLAQSLLLWGLLGGGGTVGLATDSSSATALERDAAAAYRSGQYDRVPRLLDRVPAGQAPSRELLRLTFLSQLKLGQPEAALATYHKLVPEGQVEQLPQLRALALAFVTGHTRDPQEYVRIAAYTTLAELSLTETAPLLEDGLLDISPLVRARAIEGLGRIAAAAPVAQRTTAIGALKRALRDAAPGVRIAALDALGTVGTEKDRSLLDAVIAMARTEEGAVNIFALAALARLGRAQAFDELLGAATLPDSDTRMAAIGLLGRLRRPAARSVLAQSIYDPDESVRAFAAGALGEFGDPAANSVLTQALTDESPRVRGTAATSLGRLGNASAKPFLRQALHDPADLVRVSAVEGLIRLGDADAILFAADLAKHDAPSVRGAVAQAVGIPGNVTALPLLEQLLADRQPQPRLAAARALGKVGDRRAIPALKKILSDGDPAIRLTAGGSLVRLISAAMPARQKQS